MNEATRKSHFFLKKQNYDEIASIPDNKAWFMMHPQAEIAFKQLSLNFRDDSIIKPKPVVEAQELAEKERIRLNRKYPFLEKELPFCIVLTAYNNARDYLYDYNLQSLYNLVYDPKKLHVVFVDDVSHDGTADLIQGIVDRNPPPFNFTLVRNKKRMTGLPNIVNGIWDHCGPNDIVILADGDD